MAIGLAQSAHTEKVGSEPAAGDKKQGTLKTEGGKEYTLVAFADSESVTEAVNQFLQEANQQKRPPETLLEFVFVHITPELVDIENEIAHLLGQLASKQPDPKSLEKPAHSIKGEIPLPENGPVLRDGQKPVNGQRNPQNSGHNAPKGGSEVVYSSLFTLARTFNSTLFGKREQSKTETPKNDGTQSREEGRPALLAASNSPFERTAQEQNRFERDGEGKQGRDGKDKENDQEEGQQNPHKSNTPSVNSEKKKRLGGIGGIQAARENPQSASAHGPRPTSPRAQATGGSTSSGPRQAPASIDSIYIRFMALMARILGQAELEAHELYLRIKERTDNVDVLTLLLSKINSEKGAIDWTNNEEMKNLIEKARAIGVDIPKDKLKWSEDEKKLLKENIQMRKDSMEKVTQLERTDMQRYLQEASQCHQARSNILKLLKEVTDTIIANLRP